MKNKKGDSNRTEELIVRIDEVEENLSSIKEQIREIESTLRSLRVQATIALPDRAASSLAFEDQNVKEGKFLRCTDHKGNETIPRVKKGEYLLCDDKADNKVHVNDTVILSPSKQGRFAGITRGKVLGLYFNRPGVLSIEVQRKVPASPNSYKYIVDQTWRECRSVEVHKRE